jgi:hypothetical protein
VPLLELHIVACQPPGGVERDGEWTWFDDDLLACIAAAKRSPHPGVMIVVGPRRGLDRARAAGFPGTVVGVPAVLGDAGLAASRVRKAWRVLGEPESVICWGDAAAEAAVRLGVPRVALRRARGEARRSSVAQDAIRWLSRLPAARSRPEFVPMDDVDASDASDAGFDGLRGAREPGVVRVLLAGRAPDADAMRFVFVLGLLHEAGQRVRGIIPAGAASISRARRFARASGNALEVIVSTRPLSELLAQSDVAVWVGPGTGPTRGERVAPGAADEVARRCVASGVPFVAPRAAIGTEPSGQDHPGLRLCMGSSLPEIARVLVPLIREIEAGSAMGARA